jgi:starch synthase
MNIVWATSEAHPFAKTGGLADVSYALPEALAKQGHQVSVIMPFYPQVMAKLDIKFTSKHQMLGVPFGEKTEWSQILEYKLSENLTFYFIEFHRFYDRPALYSWGDTEYSDNGQRFIFLSRAVMQAVLALDLYPDILHANDWHTALCCVYLKSWLYWDYENFKNCRSILTIHNIGYQGTFHKSNLLWTGLGWEYFNFHCLEFYDKLNLLKSGIMTADMVNTVSPTYAEEILSPPFAFDLHDPLCHCAFRGRLRGILNGIDDQEWDPSTDKLIPANFSADDLSGKDVCKAALQKQFNLPERPNVPLVGLVSRLAYQKGIDVFIESLEDMLYHDDFQFVVLGSGEYWLENRLNELAARYPGKIGIYIGYSDQVSHLVEAGSDFFVMPSRYEPCGLNQMYSMRYGTLPIVRATGGLEDTVCNYSPEHLNDSTGFKFFDLYPFALTCTVRWAAYTYLDRHDDFRRMQQNGMRKDFSWNHTAELYRNLYQDAHR